MGNVIKFPKRHLSPVERFHRLILPHLKGLTNGARARVCMAGHTHLPDVAAAVSRAKNEIEWERRNMERMEAPCDVED